MPRTSGPAPCADDAAIVLALQEGDEDVFAALVDAHHSALLRVGMAYGCTREDACEVVQETWLKALEGLHRFECDMSLRAWICGIAAGIARVRAAAASGEAPVDRRRTDGVVDALLTAIQRLPPDQRVVVTLRDLEGWSADETCQALHLAEAVQRDLLHRARSALCAARARDPRATSAAA